MDINLLKIIDRATKAVPATKYAVGILGLAGVVALAKQFNKDINVAVWGTIILIALMVLLVLFAKMTETATKEFKIPVRIIMWACAILFIFSCTLLFTSVFLGWPQLHPLYKEKKRDEKISPTNINTHTDTLPNYNAKDPSTNIKINRSPKSTVIIGDSNKVINN